ncbi:nitronate monooxygenase [Mycobacterium saskatchewanense]|uniref:nitronate monooxygenase n=1 Tax=Mycobacterium saskatchewanense TaxID=220927 RepID=UPI00114FD67E|nr:nitronate monooxygenase [Mycobacterium saskatchewanense]
MHAGPALVLQVIDIAGTIPVVATGGIADGRGLAAVPALGAQAVNRGTLSPPSSREVMTRRRWWSSTPPPPPLRTR